MTKTIVPRPTAEVSPHRYGPLFPRSLFGDWFEQFLPETTGMMQNAFNATMDVAETDQAFEVTMDLPGVQAEDVDIQVENNTLTVRGERSEKKEEEDKEKQYHRIERYSGSFARSVVLPSSIDENEAAAEFKDGVLKVVVPKSQEAKPRKIRITS